jgi:hypothetical protein
MSLENLSLEARDELASLMQTLAESPDTREDILRLTKRVKPNLNIPEIDLKDRTNSELSKMREENEALRNEFRARDAKADLDERRKALVKKGLAQSDEDIQAIEKVMLEKKIADHETAAEYHQYMKEAAKPTPTGYNPSAIRGLNLNQFWKDPRGAAQQEAVKAFQDLRKPQRPIGL